MGVLESLSSYDKLLNTEYLIKIGRKGKASVLCLVFDKVDWFHTMGLHYLKDLVEIEKIEAQDMELKQNLYMMKSSQELMKMLTLKNQGIIQMKWN